MNFIHTDLGNLDKGRIVEINIKRQCGKRSIT